jgi:hypothetical protein
MMNTYLVTPPTGNEPFEIKAADYYVDNDSNTIFFIDEENQPVATYVAYPGTLVKKI